ncbi:hypothetical protein ANO11243_056930 [Dothideomycetidae sp. 11243]|nr:hypothetical protein ANO11243_056930 [fungal sp. No.11243]
MNGRGLAIFEYRLGGLAKLISAGVKTTESAYLFAEHAVYRGSGGRVDETGHVEGQHRAATNHSPPRPCPLSAAKPTTKEQSLSGLPPPLCLQPPAARDQRVVPAAHVAKCASGACWNSPRRAQRSPCQTRFQDGRARTETLCSHADAIGLATIGVWPSIFRHVAFVERMCRAPVPYVKT